MNAEQLGVSPVLEARKTEGSLSGEFDSQQRTYDNNHVTRLHKAKQGSGTWQAAVGQMSLFTLSVISETTPAAACLSLEQACALKIGQDKQRENGCNNNTLVDL